MKNSLTLFSLVFLTVLAGSVSAKESESAAQPYYGPPAINKNAPVTEIDKKRVKIAESILTNLLTKPIKDLDPSGSCGGEPRIAADVSCPNPDHNVRAHVQRIQSRFGLLSEFKHAHIIPATMQNFEKKIASDELQPGEYIVHAYGRFVGAPGWHHIDVVVSENERGAIMFRRFQVTPMDEPHQKMPPGVDC